MSERDIADIKDSLGKIWEVLRDLQVKVAEKYATKAEVKEATKGTVPVWMAVVLPFITLTIGWLLSRAF